MCLPVLSIGCKEHTETLVRITEDRARVEKGGQHQDNTVTCDKYVWGITRLHKNCSEITFFTATNIRLSDRMVRNMLNEVATHGRIPFKNPVFPHHHHIAWLEFAREHHIHQALELHHWWPVLVSEGNTFHISGCVPCVKVWWCQGEWDEDWNMVKHYPFGGGSIIFWGGISLDGCMELIPIGRVAMNIQRYRN